MFRLRTLDHSIEQGKLFGKQISSNIQELCYENKHLLNDIVNGITSDLLTSLADLTIVNKPSTALANIIDLLQECPNENLLDTFILTIDDDRLVYVLIVNSSFVFSLVTFNKTITMVYFNMEFIDKMNNMK